MRVLLSLLPWLGLAALIWYTVRCVAADRKPRMEIVVPLMLLPWVLATWGGCVTMQKYAIVVYDKRNGAVFTTLMQAEDGTAAVAAMNRKDWGTSLRPLSLILLPKPGSEK